VSVQDYAVVTGRHLGISVRTLERRGTSHGDSTAPRLRFDRVATRLIDRLRANVADAVPDGTTALVTVTAPIRLASKTAAALEATIRPIRDRTHTIHGNRVEIRTLHHGLADAPRVVVLVHNPDSNPLVLFEMTRELVEVLQATARTLAAKRAAEGCIIVTSARTIACLDAYRSIYSQVRTPRSFRKILMVFGDGRIGVLT
jgi:hypothetical protein